MSRYPIAALAVLLALVLGACRYVPAEERNATPTPEPTATAEPTETPEPSPTPEPTATPPPPFETTFEETSCPFDLPAGLRAECGVVIVPEDHTAPDEDDALEIAVARFQSRSPDEPPALFIQGGPGAPAIEPIANNFAEQFLAPLLDDRDVILFDARGTGFSEPDLGCREVDTLRLPEDAEPETINAAVVEALGQCQRRLERSGIDIQSYTSADVAEDIVDILTALEVETAHIIGSSYGSYIAQELIRANPEVVESAVFDSPLPLSARLYNDSVPNAQYALEQIFIACEQSEACDAAYPDIDTVYADLIDQLNAEPLDVAVPNAFGGEGEPVPVTGQVFQNLLVGNLYTSFAWPFVPEVIIGVAEGNTEFLARNLALQGQRFGEISEGQQLALTCHEQLYATTPEELAEALTLSPEVDELTLSVAYDADSLFAVCDAWGAAPFDEAASQPLETDLPILLVSGEYDPVTPFTYAVEMEAQLPNSTLVVFERGGHAPPFDPLTGPCAVEILVDFLDDPSGQVNDACIDDLPQPNFVVPFQADSISFEREIVGAFGLGLEVPRGWQLNQFGNYTPSGSLLDYTQLGVARGVLTPDDILTFSQQNVLILGLPLADEPTPNGTRTSEGLTWTLYRGVLGEQEGQPVDFALAEVGDGSTVIVVLVSRDEAEQEVLFDAVFLPVVDSVTILN